MIRILERHGDIARLILLLKSAALLILTASITACSPIAHYSTDARPPMYDFDDPLVTRLASITFEVPDAPPRVEYQCTVLVDAEVSAKGVISNVRVVRDSIGRTAWEGPIVPGTSMSPHAPVTVAAAIRAVENGVATPALHGEERVARRLRVSVGFNEGRKLDRYVEVTRWVDSGYPQRLRETGVEGRVLVELLVDATGLVQVLDVLQGDPRLASPLLTAVSRTAYEPAIFEGKPVSMWVTLGYKFVLY